MDEFWTPINFLKHLGGPSLTTMSIAVMAQALPNAGGIDWGTVGSTGSVCVFCGWLLTRTIPDMQRAQAEVLKSQEDSHAAQFATLRDEWKETRADIRSHVERMISAIEGSQK